MKMNLPEVIRRVEDERERRVFDLVSADETNRQIFDVLLLRTKAASAFSKHSLFFDV